MDASAENPKSSDEIAARNQRLKEIEDAVRGLGLNEARTEWKDFAQKLVETRPPEPVEDRVGRLWIAKAASIFSILLLAGLTAFLCYELLYAGEDAKHWAQTLLAGEVGAALSFLFGARGTG